MTLSSFRSQKLKKIFFKLPHNVLPVSQWIKTGCFVIMWHADLMNLKPFFVHPVFIFKKVGCVFKIKNKHECLKIRLQSDSCELISFKLDVLLIIFQCFSSVPYFYGPWLSLKVREAQEFHNWESYILTSFYVDPEWLWYGASMVCAIFMNVMAILFHIFVIQGYRCKRLHVIRQHMANKDH